MRTLKKTLALVLCLAMIAGLCCIGTSAAFADADQIENTEAVEVMNALGVLKGDGTNYNPKGILTRAEAAVMLAKLIGEGNVKSTSTYKDMKGYEWAQQYAAVCEAKGFILGDGKGNFLPGNTLTGYQFGLMLCRALGYKPAEEGVESATYEIGTAALMKRIGLDKAIVNFDGTAGLTRENAAALMLKALQTTMVEYSNAGTTITGAGFTITTGASAASAQKWIGGEGVDLEDGSVSEANDTKEMAEVYFPGLILTAPSKDYFERPANTWTYKTFTGTYPAAPVATFTGPVAEKDIFAVIGTTGTTATLEAIYEDGIELYYLNSAARTVDKYKAAPWYVAGTGNGITSEIYKTATGYIMVCVREYLATVTGINPAIPTSETKRSVNITLVGSAAPLESADGVCEAYITEDFAANDVVVVTVAREGGKNYVKSAKLATTVSGVCSKITSGGVYTIGGKDYVLSQNKDTAPSVSTTAGEYYVDSFGNILDVKVGGAAAVNYALVIDRTTAFTQDANGNLVPNYAFKVVGTDAAVSLIPVDQTHYNAFESEYKGQIVEWTAADIDATTGLYNVEDVEDANDGSTRVESVTAFTTKTNTMTGPTAIKYADASTKFIFVDYKADGTTLAGTVSSVTGIDKVGTYSGLTATTTWAVDTTPVAIDTVADVVFVFENATATASDSYVYVKGTYADTAVRTWDTIVAGQASSFVTTSAVNFAAGAIDTTDDTLEAGLYSALAWDGTTLTGTAASAVANVHGIKVNGGMLYTTTTDNSNAAAATWAVHTTPAVAATVPVYTIHTLSGTCDTATAAEIGSIYNKDAAVYVVKPASDIIAIYVTIPN